ncbi:MAG: AI-2E family transporter [Sulfurovaceae bacterium]|nr:AI-2E family transporter [Sulfurovaceae bacterium]MDD5548330.1 AI-2E family transporter [Sulfurovaceae bacterium]
MEQKLFVRVIIIITIGIFGWLFYPFLKSFFVALLLVIAFSPIHLHFEKYFQKYFKSSDKIAIATATIETIILITILFIPILFFTYYIATNPQEIIKMIVSFYQQLEHILSLIPDSMQWLEKPLKTLSQQLIVNKDKIYSTIAINFGNTLLGFLKAMVDMILIVIFFFLLTWYQKSLILTIVPIIPIKRSIIQEFAQDLISTTATGFYTLISIALLQGIAFGIFISFFDGYNSWILGLMISVTSIIPLLGTTLIWIPIALKEFFNGNIISAIIIFIYSWAMISFFIDNIVRLLVLKKINHLLSKTLKSGHKPVNDFLIFFAIIAGLNTFGFWGVILGPAIVAFATTLLRVLKHGYIHSKL